MALLDMMDNNEPLIWRTPSTWMPFVSAWLRPHLIKGAQRLLRGHDTSEFYDDDPDWTKLLGSFLRSDISIIEQELVDALEQRVVRCYHGCRTEDAGVYFRRGIRVHRREELEDQLRKLVASCDRLQWMLPTLPDRMARFESRIDRQRCYVVLDDRALINMAAHYLIYGSEWICAVLGHGLRGPLLDCGVPTMIEANLPMSRVSPGLKEELSQLMLREWTRQVAASPNRTCEVDFTFTLHEDLPASFVVDHYHPTVLTDPLEGMAIYRSPKKFCAYCSNSNQAYHPASL